MTRFKQIDGIRMPFTKEEEIAKDAEEKAWADEQVELKKTQYQRDRQQEYPPMADYLDGIVKGNQAQIDKYIADCLEIKQKHPKP
jgi:hypothetical protein